MNNGRQFLSLFAQQTPFEAQILSTTVQPCPNGYTLCSSGYCFKVVSTPATQSQAEASCEADGGHLASIHSDADTKFVQALIVDAGFGSGFTATSDCDQGCTGTATTPNCGLWIGLQTIAAGSTNLADFFWNDGTEFVNNDFHTGQPNNNHCTPGNVPQACVATSLLFFDPQPQPNGNYQWDDEACELFMLGFVCKTVANV